MKNLKKLSLVFTIGISVLFMGCSSEDDSDEVVEPFVGVWKPLKEVEVCSETPSYTYNYSSCEQKGRLTINANGTFSQSSFYEFYDEQCTQDVTETGEWNISDGNLKVSIYGDVVDITFFELKDNTLKLGQLDDDLGCDEPSSHYYTEYVRMN